MQTPNTPTELLARWQNLGDGSRRVRAHDAARDLGVSELTLVASQVGSAATWLRPDWDELLPRLGALGPVMALTRNPSCVIEKHGLWAPYSRTGHVGLVLDKGLDLRLFLSCWAYAVSVQVDNARGPLDSLQFFDASGLALHKIYRQPASDEPAWRALVADLTATEQPAAVTTIARQNPAPSDAPVDVPAFQKDWLSLQDTHDFFPLLRRYGLDRLGAFRLAPEGMAQAVSPQVCGALLHTAAARALPIMVFVGNRGCIEIHSGPIARVRELGTWLNVMDPDFNLHLQTADIAEAWIVRKPTRDGLVTSVEVFDKDGENIAMFFGERKPGIPEREDWRDLVAELT